MKDLVIIPPKMPEVKFDFETAKTMFETELVDYKNLVVTEDTIPDCKKSRAELNKLIKSIDNQRLELRKACLAPYEKTKPQIDILINLGKEALGYLDEGLKKYEDERIKEKTATCEKILAEKIAESGLRKEYANKVSLPAGFANKGMSGKAISDSIDTSIINLLAEQDRFDSDVENAKAHIDLMNDTLGLKAKLTVSDFERYFKSENFDLAFVVQEISTRAKSRHEAENRVEEVVIQEELEVADEVAEKLIKSIPRSQEEILNYTIELKCTKSEFNAVGLFLKSTGIAFEEVDDF